MSRMDSWMAFYGESKCVCFTGWALIYLWRTLNNLWRGIGFIHACAFACAQTTNEKGGAPFLICKLWSKIAPISGGEAMETAAIRRLSFINPTKYLVVWKKNIDILRLVVPSVLLSAALESNRELKSSEASSKRSYTCVRVHWFLANLFDVYTSLGAWR